MKEYSYLQGNGLFKIIYGFSFKFRISYMMLMFLLLFITNSAKAMICIDALRTPEVVLRYKEWDFLTYFWIFFFFGNVLRCSFSEIMQSNGLFFLNPSPFFFDKSKWFFRKYYQSLRIIFGRNRAGNEKNQLSCDNNRL